MVHLHGSNVTTTPAEGATADSEDPGEQSPNLSLRRLM